VQNEPCNWAAQIAVAAVAVAYKEIKGAKLILIATARQPQPLLSRKCVTHSHRET